MTDGFPSGGIHLDVRENKGLQAVYCWITQQGSWLWCGTPSLPLPPLSHTAMCIWKQLPHPTPSDAPQIGISFHTHKDGKENSTFASRVQLWQTARGKSLLFD